MHDFVEMAYISFAYTLKHFNINVKLFNQTQIRRKKRKKISIKSFSSFPIRAPKHPPPALESPSIFLKFSFFTIFLTLLLVIIGISINTKAETYNDIVVPVVASAKGGYGSDWRSDVWIYNGDRTTEAVLYLFYAPQGQTADFHNPNKILTIGRGKTVYLEDIVNKTFNTQGAGALFIEVYQGDPKKVIVESNVYNRVDEIKQYGQQLPGIHYDDIPTEDENTFFLPGSLDTANYRANLGVTTLNASQLFLRLRGPPGTILHEENIPVPQYSYIQFNDIIKYFNLPNYNDIYLEVDSAGKIIPFISHVDNKTNDGSAFLGLTLSRIDTDNWFPGVARAPGAQGSEWRSSFFEINPNDIIAYPGLNFIPMGKTIDEGIGQGDRIEPWDHKTYEDVLLNKFYLYEGGVGGMIITTLEDGSDKILPWLRTYNNTPEGTYGQNIPVKGWKNEMIRGPPLYVNSGCPEWDEVGILTGVNHNDLNRANLILQNSSTARSGEFVSIDATIQIRDSEGNILGSKIYTLQPGEYKQINRFVEDILGEGATVTNATVEAYLGNLPRWDNYPDPWNHTKGGLDARISVVNGNVYQGTNDGRLITFQKIDYYPRNQSGDFFNCNGDYLCEKAAEYVKFYFDQSIDPYDPPGMQYDPDGDNRGPFSSF